ncbi:gag/pol protein [Cucumis melo var. makuwa]|uniref:Gag/pol protein n=1 Tax=Cucumis melo var. makuwa TaxID=1194695 RepID=A0A5A7T9X7_CUCMM|nr:gag/pol protein [Cucumis melo var. makuwa]
MVPQEAIKYIYTKQMKEETSVRERVLDMMMHFNIAKINGGSINEENQVSFILQSLSKSFVPFQMNESLNKIEFTLTTLLNELQQFQNLTMQGDEHWLRNCPKYLAEKKAKKEVQGKYDLLTIQTKLVLEKLVKTRSSSKFGTKEVVSAEAVGDLKLFR